MKCRIPIPLLLEAAEELQRRTENHGTWQNGLPACFVEIRKLYLLQDDVTWVAIVETAVKNALIEYVTRHLPQVYKGPTSS